MDAETGIAEVVVLSGRLRGRTLTAGHASGFHPELVRRPVEVLPTDGWTAGELARLDGRIIGVYGELKGTTITITGIWPEK
jgi:hypothetical protein